MSTYCELGKPELHCRAESGWAIFAGGYRAWLSEWDNFELGRIDDFVCYAPVPQDKFREQLTAWLANPTAKLQPSAPPPNERSCELGRQSLAQALCRYSTAEPQVAPAPKTYNPNGGNGYGL